MRQLAIAGLPLVHPAFTSGSYVQLVASELVRRRGAAAPAMSVGASTMEVPRQAGRHTAQPTELPRYAIAATGGHTRHRAWLGVLAAAASALALRIPFVGEPAYTDEGGYLLVARQWHAGVDRSEVQWLQGRGWEVAEIERHDDLASTPSGGSDDMSVLLVADHRGD